MRRRWTPEEDAILRAHYADTRTEDLVPVIGRALGSIYQRAQHFGLHKSEAFRASPVSGRTNGRQGIGTRFVKGQAPANKGLRRPGWHRGRMKETQFTKGALPHNTVPIGTERVRDGYVWIKVRDDVVPARRCWLSKHQYLWEQANGPLPDGHIVRFKDNDRTNLALANLECVSRAEHVATRGLHALPPELVQIHQLRGAIARQINKRQPPAPKKRTGRPPKTSTQQATR
jgi:hypothetical protein